MGRSRKNLKRSGPKVTRRPQLQRFKKVFTSSDVAARWDTHASLGRNYAALGLEPRANTAASIATHAAARLGLPGAVFVDLDEVAEMGRAVLPVEAPRRPADWVSPDDIAYLAKIVAVCVASGAAAGGRGCQRRRGCVGTGCRS